MKTKKYSLKELADFLGAALHGDPQCVIFGIAALDKAKAGQISFLEKADYRQHLAKTEASAVILRAEDFKEVKHNVLIVPDPYVAYAKLTALFVEKQNGQKGIHATVIVGKDCKIDNTANIGPYSVLGDAVKIAEHVEIGPGCVIGDHVEIGSETQLRSRITLYNSVKIGERVLIHSGAVIGADGFGMANDKGKWQKIYQLGSVVIGNDVEIGANTTIDRGALDNTIIEDGVKLDNQIQVGHNVQIGAYTAIAGCVGIAGSTIIGKHCMIGGGVGISDHIKIADGSVIAGRSNVAKSIEKPDIYASIIPAMPRRIWWRILTRIMQLDDFAKRLQKLEKHLAGE
jgi:UDP-3-O-[3-hydroxymyristoyl] glucosamine N-acyltransferase